MVRRKGRSKQGAPTVANIVLVLMDNLGWGELVVSEPLE
jgi:hypothetical protein